MLGRVETKNFLALARARIDGAQVFAPLHLPDGRHLTIFFNGVIRDLFRGNWRFRGRRRSLICVAGLLRRVTGRAGFILWHLSLKTLLS